MFWLVFSSHNAPVGLTSASVLVPTTPDGTAVEDQCAPASLETKNRLPVTAQMYCPRAPTILTVVPSAGVPQAARLRMITTAPANRMIHGHRSPRTFITVPSRAANDPIAQRRTMTRSRATWLLSSGLSASRLSSQPEPAPPGTANVGSPLLAS